MKSPELKISLKNKGGVTHKTLLMILAHLSRLVAQAVFFLLFARSMGADVFGVFSGIMAIVVIATPFFAFGVGGVLIRECSISSELLSRHMGNALLMSFCTILIAFPLLFLFQYLFFSVESAVLVFVSIFLAEFVFSKLTEVACQVFQSQGRIPKVAEVTIVAGLLRVAAVCVVYFLDYRADLSAWLFSYVFSAALGSLYAWCWCVRIHGLPVCELMWRTVKEGLYFSLGIASQGVYNDADKALMLRYDVQSVSGNYSAAYKIVDMSFAPVRALLSVTYVGFFKAGADGLSSAYKYARKILPVTVFLGFVSLVGIVIVGFLVEPVLGGSYSDVQGILWCICIIPLLRSVHFVLADCFTGAGYQRERSVVQVFFALLNVVLNIFLIPVFSWKAAALVSIVCDVGLCVVFYFMLKSKILKGKAA